MRPTSVQIEAVVGEFGMLKFFPTGEIEREAVMHLIRAMVGTQEQLDWLRSTMINRVGQWHGPADLRGVFCSEFLPLDGINATSEVPRFTQEDRNARWMEREGERITGKPDDALRLASGAEMKLLPLPPEEIVKNEALLREVERATPQRVPEPTVADREYSRKLLGGIPGLT